MKLCIVGLVLLIVAKNEGLPTTTEEPLTTTILQADDVTKKDEVRYDQRQNGTENYRIHVDGLVLVVAPVEALLLASGVGGSVEENLSVLTTEAPNFSLKPEFLVAKPKLQNDLSKTDETTSKQRSSMRLINLLTPLLKRLRN